MLVKCIGNAGKSTPYDYGLTIGETHVVCAMFCILPQSVNYCINTGHLMVAPSGFFEVVDGRTPRNWYFEADGPNDDDAAFHWGYKEFVTSNAHRAKLFDGDSDAVAIFNEFKNLCLLEYSIPNIAEVAKQLEDGWVMCAACCDAWQPVSLTDEMLRCPTCKLLQHRPR